MVLLAAEAVETRSCMEGTRNTVTLKLSKLGKLSKLSKLQELRKTHRVGLAGWTSLNPLSSSLSSKADGESQRALAELWGSLRFQLAKQHRICKKRLLQRRVHIATVGAARDHQAQKERLGRL